MKPAWFEAVRRWRDELKPTTLQARTKDLTARDYWSVYRAARRQGAGVEVNDAYSQVAKQLLQQPTIVSEMSDWLMSSDAVSASSLMFEVGFYDSKSEVMLLVLNWFKSLLGTNLVTAYFAGVSKRTGKLPDIASDALDDAVKNRPADSLQITFRADTSERGVRRAMKILSGLEEKQRGLLHQIAFDPWKNLLNVEQKCILLKQLCEWAEAGDLDTLRTAMDIVAMWRHDPTPPLPSELVPVLIQLATLSASPHASIDSYHWKQVMEAVVSAAPQQAAELLADEITNLESVRFERSQEAQKLFCSLAKNHPEIAMDAIGRWMLDKRRSVIFRLFGFRGLFDAIGIATVKPWVQAHESLAAICIARHLEGPSVKDGILHIPELADWLLSAYQHVPQVFQEFALGRHSGVVRMGHARAREADLNTFLAHFKTSSKEWVQQWIKYEQANHKGEVEMDDRIEEEDGRK